MRYCATFHLYASRALDGCSMSIGSIAGGVQYSSTDPHATRIDSSASACSAPSARLTYSGITITTERATRHIAILTREKTSPYTSRRFNGHQLVIFPVCV